MKYFNCELQARKYMKNFNKSLAKKDFHKFFVVLIDGPEDNYVVVNFNLAHEMGVGYTVVF